LASWLDTTAFTSSQLRARRKKLPQNKSNSVHQASDIAAFLLLAPEAADVRVAKTWSAPLKLRDLFVTVQAHARMMNA
jgi:hypothetical protein